MNIERILEAYKEMEAAESGMRRLASVTGAPHGPTGATGPGSDGVGSTGPAVTAGDAPEVITRYTRAHIAMEEVLEQEGLLD